MKSKVNRPRRAARYRRDRPSRRSGQNHQRGNDDERNEIGCRTGLHDVLASAMHRQARLIANRRGVDQPNDVMAVNSGRDRCASIAPHACMRKMASSSHAGRPQDGRHGSGVAQPLSLMGDCCEHTDRYGSTPLGYLPEAACNVDQNDASLKPDTCGTLNAHP